MRLLLLPTQPPRLPSTIILLKTFRVLNVGGPKIEQNLNDCGCLMPIEHPECKQFWTRCQFQCYHDTFRARPRIEQSYYGHPECRRNSLGTPKLEQNLDNCGYFLPIEHPSCVTRSKNTRITQVATCISKASNSMNAPFLHKISIYFRT